ncbi:lipase secretion chaperone [Paraburkholderia fungorum]|uniref:lipase secretion chaperone n=1 Tax=Paraburkholderia fungorum TaxID=134537 RepID=UPI0038B8DCD5
MPRSKEHRADCTWLAVAFSGAASISGVLWFALVAPVADRSSALAVASKSAPSLVVSAHSHIRTPTVDALPAPLIGSSPPWLPTDGRGHLAPEIAVRDFFDYFLTAQNAVSAEALDALVRRQIAVQLDGTAAADEALAVWQRYTAYLIALDQVPEAAAAGGDKTDLDALQRYIDQREVLAARLLGKWNEPFFGAELQQQRTDLTRLRIASDTSLTSEQKAARLAMQDAALTPTARAAREHELRQDASIEAIAQAQKQGGSPDALRAQFTQILGPEVAERVVQMRHADDAWQARYTDYSSQRAQIDMQGLPPQQRDAQIAQLRQRLFTDPGDAMRAASFDRGSGSVN